MRRPGCFGNDRAVPCQCALLRCTQSLCDRLLFIRRWITDGTHQTCQDQHSSATVREQYKCQARMKGIGARNRLQWRGNTPLRQGKGVYRTEDGLVFMMRDTQTADVVACTISSAALRRLADRSGVPLEDAFDENPRENRTNC